MGIQVHLHVPTSWTILKSQLAQKIANLGFAPSRTGALFGTVPMLPGRKGERSGGPTLIWVIASPINGYTSRPDFESSRAKSIKKQTLASDPVGALKGFDRPLWNALRCI